MPSKIAIRLSTPEDLYNTVNIDPQLSRSSVTALTLKNFVKDSKFGSLLADNSISGASLKSDVDGSKIVVETVTGSVQDVGTSPIKGKIALGTIANSNIANSTITGGKLANKTITASQIADKTITASQIADKAITGSQIADKTITASQIADKAITGSQIADDTFSSDNITDGAIVNAKLRNSAALSVIGNSTSESASPADIAASANGTVLMRNNNKLEFASMQGSSLTDNSIGLSKLNLPANFPVQVVQSKMTRGFTVTTANQWVNVDPLNVSISRLISTKPSKFRIQGCIFACPGNPTTNNGMAFKLELRTVDSSTNNLTVQELETGDPITGQISALASVGITDNGELEGCSFDLIVSPGENVIPNGRTNVSFWLYARDLNGNGYINRTVNNTTNNFRTVSTITVTELTT